MDIQRFILEHGTWSYLIAFVWTFFEGETFVLLAGFAAAQGLLNAPLLLMAAWLGSFAGDQCYFWIGRHFGLRLMARRPAWRVRVDSALGWLKRYDAGFILSFRFIYGVRNFSSFALGISGIDWRRFLTAQFHGGRTVGGGLRRRGLSLRPRVRARAGRARASNSAWPYSAISSSSSAGAHLIHRLRGKRRRAEHAAA